MTVTREEIERIAHLAALSIHDDELPRLIQQIADILDYVSHLETVAGTPEDTPYHPGPERLVLRDDTVTGRPLAVPPSDMAPRFESGFYLVPKIESLGQSE